MKIVTGQAVRWITNWGCCYGVVEALAQAGGTLKAIYMGIAATINVTEETALVALHEYTSEGGYLKSEQSIPVPTRMLVGHAFGTARVVPNPFSAAFPEGVPTDLSAFLSKPRVNQQEVVAFRVQAAGNEALKEIDRFWELTSKSWEQADNDFNSQTFSGYEFKSVEAGDDKILVARGKVFEAGTYPDKGPEAVYTEADLDYAVSRFGAQDYAWITETEFGDLDIEHVPSVMDGKIGKLRKLWRSGADLFGEVEVSKSFADMVGQTHFKVSLTWSRGPEKRIIGCAVVLDPRITDAKVAAFALQCKSARQEPGVKKMPSWKEFFSKFGFSGSPDDLDKPCDLVPGTGDPAPVPDPAKEAAYAAAKAELETIKAANAALVANQEAAVATQIETMAEAFASQQIRDRRITPAQKDYVKAQFASALQSDRSAGVDFSKGEGASVEALRKFLGAQPKIAFTAQQLAEAQVLEGGNDGEQVKMSKDRASHLLSMSPLGKEALKASN